MSNNNISIGLDDSEVAALAIDGQPAKDNDGIPYCRKHHCRMKQTSNGAADSVKRYFGCPVPGCEQRCQQIKTPNENVVPPQPLCCPRCSKPRDGKKKGEPVYCERDDRLSTAAMVILKCPSCNWHSCAMAVPQLAAAHFARKTHLPISGVGDR